MRRPGVIPADTWNTLIDTVRKAFIAPGVGYRRKITPGGTTREIKPGEARGAGEAFTFQVLVKSVDDNTVWVRPGTVNGLVPVINGEKLTNDEDAAPVLQAVEGAEQTGYVCLKFIPNPDSPTLNSVEIIAEAEMPWTHEPEADVIFYRPLALVYFDDEGGIKSIFNTVDYSLAAQFCAGGWYVTMGA